MKLYGIRHKETGKYFVPFYDRKGNLLLVNWEEGFYDLGPQVDALEMVADLELEGFTEVIEHDYGKPIVRVIE